MPAPHRAKLRTVNYFVIAADGQKYGPADVPTLNHWAQEGRVLATSMLEDAATGQQYLATSVPGLQFPLAQTYQNYLNPGVQYPLGGSIYNDDGTEDVKKVWIFGGLAFIPCCALFNLALGVLAIVFASYALRKGNPKGQTALIFAICSLIGGLLFTFAIRAALGAMVMSSLK